MKKENLISVFEHGELVAESRQRLHIYFGGDGLFPLRLALLQGVAVGINNGSAARIMALRVIAHAIDTDDIALVLNRPRPEQCAPRVLPRLRPTGHVYHRIIVLAAAAPHGEAEVVAYQQDKADALPLHHRPTVSSRITLVLVAVGEEVVLVVECHLARGLHKIQPVAEVAAQLRGHAARNGGAGLLRHALHPQERGLVLFCNALGVCSEPRAPHLRQHIQVAARVGLNHSLHAGGVFLRLAPHNIRLYCGYYHLFAHKAERIPYIFLQNYEFLSV